MGLLSIENTVAGLSMNDRPMGVLGCPSSPVLAGISRCCSHNLAALASGFGVGSPTTVNIPTSTLSHAHHPDIETIIPIHSLSQAFNDDHFSIST